MDTYVSCSALERMPWDYLLNRGVFESGGPHAKELHARFC